MLVAACHAARHQIDLNVGDLQPCLRLRANRTAPERRDARIQIGVATPPLRSVRTIPEPSSSGEVRSTMSSSHSWLAARYRASTALVATVTPCPDSLRSSRTRLA